MKCPNCQTDNPSDSKFCKECATPLPSKEIFGLPTETLQTPVRELATGTTFAGRYQVIEELGKGGMGRVYKVFDTKIKEKIGLKLIKPDISTDKETIERFSNELKLARKIRHKNVCGMFDLGEAEGALFITMEYVHGEDLKSMIRMSKQMSVGAILSIGKQVAEGLAEAHSLGVVHRDLKPQNIMIDKGGNAKIMDFGIARSIREKGITGPWVMVGTPEYMSPEQVESKDVDQRSDIYSLGVILYEMATGQVPFEGETALAIAMKHKGEMPKDPKLLNPSIPDDLSRLILRCLEKDKKDRYQSASEVYTDLDLIEKGLPTTERVVPERKPLTSREITVTFRLKKLIIPVAICLAVIAAALVFLFKTRGSLYDTKRVIVSVFENQTGDKSLDSIGRIASDWITQGLSKTGLVEIVSLPPGETAPGTPKEAERIQALAKEAGAGTLVSGSYFLQEKTLSIHAQVTDMSKGKLIKALDPVSGPVEDPLKAIEFLRQKIMGAFAGITDPKMKSFIDILGQPPTYEAYKEFTEGEESFKLFNYRQAIEHFSRAAELDSGFKSPLLMAATAHINLGEYAKAEELVNEVDKFRETLSPIERPNLDWLKAMLNGDLAGRLRVMRQQAQKMGGLSLYQQAYDAVDNNYPREAVRALSKLDPEGIWMKGWVPYWNYMTRAYHMLRKHKQELRQARRGRKQYPENMSVLYYEARALGALGRIDEMNKLVDESFNLPASRSYNPGLVMIHAAQELKIHGFKKESFQLLDRAFKWFEARPKEEAETKTFRQQLASAFYLAEKWEEARTLYEALLKEEPDNIDYLTVFGTLAARRGDREEALRISKQLEDLKTPYLWGSHTYNRACIASLLGEKENAINLIRQAISQGQTYWNLYTDIDLEPLRDYPPFKELIKPKR